jgi:predicted nucleotidyltransferase
MNKNPISIEEVKEKTVPIFRAHPVVKVILFGSYAKNDATDNSDIDLYIDSAGKLRGLDFVGLLEKLVDTLGKDVDLIDKTHIEPNSIILQEIEKGGIVLYEKSEAFNKNN